MTDIYRFQTWAANTVAGSPVKKAILMALAYIADWESGRCEAKHDTLAKYVEVSEAAVGRNLREMESAGLVDRRAQYRADGGRRGNEYLLLAPGVTAWPDGMPTTSQRAGTPTERPDVDPPSAPARPHHAPQTGQELPPVEQPLGNNRLQLLTGGEATETPATPCWDLPPDDEKWEPTHSVLSPDALRLAREGGVNWVDPPDARVVFDFWRDLHWHMEARMVPSREEAIRTALKHYPLEMVCRAIAGGLTDRFIQGEGGPFDKLETMIAITSKRDNVDRLGHQVSDLELANALLLATQNRSQIAWYRAERWEMVDEEWQRNNRARLKRDNEGRYRRLLAYRKQQGGVEVIAS